MKVKIQRHKSREYLTAEFADCPEHWLEETTDGGHEYKFYTGDREIEVDGSDIEEMYRLWKVLSRRIEERDGEP